MATMNISLPEEMKVFVEEQAAKQGFSTVSEYVRSLRHAVQEQERSRSSWRRLIAVRRRRWRNPIGRAFGRKSNAVTWLDLVRVMAARKPGVVKLRPAVLDIVEIADHIAQSASLAAARRFVANVEKTSETLARNPGLGMLWDDELPRLRDVRFFPVARIRKHLNFYRPVEGGIELVRVLHGNRDLEGIFGSEED